MAVTVDTSGLDRLMESWDALVKQFPEKKRGLLEQIGARLLQEVRTGIGGTGKVSGWQAPHMGSGGGYVAVRPKAETYQTTKSGKRYAVGYITNAIEGGHRRGEGVPLPAPLSDGGGARPLFLRGRAGGPGRYGPGGGGPADAAHCGWTGG